MANKVTFSPETVAGMFNTVKGHSSIAKLSGSEPVAFSGNEYFTFSTDSHSSLVTEGGKKPAAEAKVASVVARPFKLVFQSRVSDEFLNCSEEKRLDYLTNFSNAMAKVIAKDFDIVAFHGVDPATGTEDSTQKAACFDTKITNAVKYDETKPDANIKAGIALLGDADVNGAAISPALKTALSNMETSTGAEKYPEIGWGTADVTSIKGLPVDANSSVSYGSAGVEAYVGDFQNALKWGFAQDVTIEAIEYGDPDGTGVDLKNTNQVCLRAEAYLGYAILDADSFAKVVDNAE